MSYHFHNIHYSSLIIHSDASLMRCCFLTLVSVAGGEDRHFSEKLSFMSSMFDEWSHEHISVKAQTGTCDFQQFPLCRRGLSQWPSRKWAINRSMFSITNITSFTPLIKLSAHLFEEHERKTSLASLHLCPSCSKQAFLLTNLTKSTAKWTWGYILYLYVLWHPWPRHTCTVLAQCHMRK